MFGHDVARRSALAAADHLMSRFLEPAGIIQAWGDLQGDLRSEYDAEQPPLAWDTLKGMGAPISKFDAGAGYEVLHGA